MSEWKIFWIDQGNRSLLECVVPGVFDEPIQPERLSTYLSSPANWLAIASVDGVVVGMAMAVVHHHPDKPTELYLDEIGVGLDWRRRGIASELLDRLRDRANKTQINTIWLATTPGNRPANSLFERYATKSAASVIFSIVS